MYHKVFEVKLFKFHVFLIDKVSPDQMNNLYSLEETRNQFYKHVNPIFSSNNVIKPFERTIMIERNVLVNKK